MAAVYTMEKASQLSGIPQPFLKAWESRYKVVEPVKNKNGQVHYSEEDVAKLSLLSHLVEEGHRIGSLVNYQLQELEELWALKGRLPRNDYIEAAMEATRQFDAPRLEAVLETAAGDLGAVPLVDRVIHPFMVEVGRAWQDRKSTRLNSSTS